MTEIQKAKHIVDDNNDFFIDTYKSAGTPTIDQTLLMGRLVLRSKDAINWLVTYGIDLDDVKMLGGHSHPRTHRNSGEIHIGSYIFGKLVEKVNTNGNIIVKTDTTVTDLLSEGDEVVGIVTDKSELIYADSVILTCGGFSFNREMIKRYRPDLENYPTTNGEYRTESLINPIYVILIIIHGGFILACCIIICWLLYVLCCYKLNSS